MRQAIEEMKRRLLAILGEELTALYLYGSVALGDFKPGWSDIDMLCFTKEPVGEEAAKTLVNLRQTMLSEEPQNPYYRLFEGAVVSLREFCSGAYTRVVYWGTSGQRVTDTYCFDAFSRYELLHDGLLVCGTDVRGALEAPDFAQLKDAVRQHLGTIRRYAVRTDDSLYACGWLLDIARGLYTLRTGRVIAKTAAGEWALEQGLCPAAEEMRRTLQIRKDPARYLDDGETKAWLSSLGPAVQRFADVLESELAGSGC